MTPITIIRQVDAPRDGSGGKPPKTYLCSDGRTYSVSGLARLFKVSIPLLSWRLTTYGPHWPHLFAPPARNGYRITGGSTMDGYQSNADATAAEAYAKLGYRVRTERLKKLADPAALEQHYLGR